MKLEKREITLNEKDSVRDLFFLEKGLFSEYAQAVDKMGRKETREKLMGFMKEVVEDMFLAKDLMKKMEE